MKKIILVLIVTIFIISSFAGIIYQRQSLRSKSISLNEILIEEISNATSLRSNSINHYNWETQIVDMQEIIGHTSSIILDSLNRPHISYYANKGLKYAHWDGLTWQNETIDTEEYAGYYQSIAIDTFDNPFIQIPPAISAVLFAIILLLTSRVIAPPCT